MANTFEIMAQFFAPLLEALEDVDSLQSLMSDLGVDLPLTAAHHTVVQDILPVAQDLRAILAEAQDDAAGNGITEQELFDLVTVVLDALASLATVDTSQIQSLSGTLTQAATWRRLGRELPGYLLLIWLDDFLPVAKAFLALGGAVERIPRGAGQLPRERLDWEATGLLLRNPPAQIADTWSFGGDAFNANGFISALAVLLHAFGFRARVVQTPGIVTQALGNRAPNAQTQALDGRLLAGSTSLPGAGGATVQALLSLVMTGATRPNVDTPSGLAVLPVLSGGFNLPPQVFADDISFELTASGEAAGGAGFAYYPSGPELLTGQGAVDANVVARLSGAPVNAAGETGWVIAGARDASHLRLDRFAATVLVETNPPEMRVTLDLADALALRIAAAEGGDGLVNFILGDTEVEVFGGFSATWSSRDGWSFDGGVGLEVTVPIEAELRPFYLDSITIAGWAGTTGFGSFAALTGSFSLGPIFLYFEEMGVQVDLVPTPEDAPGNFGALDARPSFKAPTGYGASLDFTPITGGGLVIKDAPLPHLEDVGSSYRGALALSFKLSKINYGLSAFALLSTELPDGRDGFSFAASVFLDFSVPLAAGFFLTGCGGVLGINRTLDTDAMRDVLFDGRLDDLLFPANPIEDAPQILDDMAAIMPVAPGQHFAGPVARISYGVPTIFHITLGVVIEVGNQPRLVILGSVKLVLPDEEHALVMLQLSFFGVIDFAAGRIDFDATLEGSRVLFFTITGDVAIRTGWGPGIFQIASFGGLHPLYPRPDNLSELRRLSAGFGQPGDDVRLTISSYFAQTQNALMFGARAELFAQGPKFPILGRVSAEGHIGFDALIYFNPFSFIVDVDGGISLMVNGKVKAALYFALSMRGPNPFFISGEVWVKVCKVKVRFGVTCTFGREQAAPANVTSAVEKLREALGAVSALSAGAGQGDAAGRITFRQTDEVLIEPLGTLQLTQTALPLDISLEKLGEAQISGAKRLDIVLLQDGNALPQSDVTDDFVRAHYFEASRSERLRAPSMEVHKAGVEITDSGAAIKGASIGESYEYEVIMVGERDSSKFKPLDAFSKVEFGKLADQFAYGRTAQSGAAATLPSVRDGVKMRAEAFVPGSVTDNLAGKAPDDRLDILDAQAKRGTQTLSRITKEQRAAEPGINAAVADYLSAA
ncbi:DUF6603 domain-containing protein [uncultured Tateyamaria sp.]|uniref:DUF6603 domain-containing protein n=1 Tax=Tateyamaria sp. 1078 TaxID=3417464 RepID=UPI002635BB24|nr:DUF6603 domain-containing protein [uncultured Tateyamaria sp.]